MGLPQRPSWTSCLHCHCKVHSCGRSLRYCHTATKWVQQGAQKRLQSEICISWFVACLIFSQHRNDRAIFAQKHTSMHQNAQGSPPLTHHELARSSCIWRYHCCKLSTVAHHAPCTMHGPSETPFVALLLISGHQCSDHPQGQGHHAPLSPPEAKAHHTGP